MLRTLLCLLCLSAPALADTAMTAAEFEAWSIGRTLDYVADGAPWGSEMHLPNRATIDADEGASAGRATGIRKAMTSASSTNSAPAPSAGAS